MPSPIDLCLASDVAGDLNTTETAVARSVTAASAMIANYLGFPLEQATITESPASDGGRVFTLARVPVQSVGSISVYGQPISSTTYLVDAASGLVRNAWSFWPRTATVGGYITPIIERYDGNPAFLSVTYTAGYVTPGQNALDPTTYPAVTLPSDIQEAAIQVATGLYKLRGGDPSLASEGLGDWSVSYRDPTQTNALSEAAKALLAPYRRAF